MFFVIVFRQLHDGWVLIVMLEQVGNKEVNRRSAVESRTRLERCTSHRGLDMALPVKAIRILTPNIGIITAPGEKQSQLMVTMLEIICYPTAQASSPASILEVTSI